MYKQGPGSAQEKLLQKMYFRKKNTKNVFQRQNPEKIQKLYNSTGAKKKPAKKLPWAQGSFLAGYSSSLIHGRIHGNPVADGWARTV